MNSNNVFQYSKIRTRKQSAKKSIKTGKKMESSSFWNPESTVLESGIRNPVPGIRNPQHGIQNPRLSRILLHGATKLLSEKLAEKSRFRELPTKYRKCWKMPYRLSQDHIFKQ